MAEVQQKLRLKQRMFVNEYIVDFNATQAAIRAGYSERNAGNIASEHLEKAHIQQEIEEAVEHAERATLLTRTYILSTIYETVERCKRGEEVFNKNGEVTGTRYDNRAIIMGCELAGRYYRMWGEKDKGDSDGGSKVLIMGNVNQVNLGADSGKVLAG